MLIIMYPRQIVRVVFAVFALAIAVVAQDKPDGNLALTARAMASSPAEGTRAENLIDGDIAHNRWAAKDGSNPTDTWVELDWPNAVQFQEIVVRQEGDQKLRSEGGRVG